MNGFIPSSGSGDNGVLLIGEAGGETEAATGTAFTGKAGEYMWQNLSRVGIEPQGFRVHNVLSCRPYQNKISGMPYEAAAIQQCSTNLNATIKEMQDHCQSIGKTFTIVAIGKTAFKALMQVSDKHPLMREDYLLYPFWSDTHQAWIMSVPHPAYLMRGSHHLLPCFRFGFTRALEIAGTGLTLDTHQYILDPAPSTFDHWVTTFLNELKYDPTLVLSYDIETPGKQGQREDDLPTEERDDYIILRCSFSYRTNEGVSVPWSAEYIPALMRLFASQGQKCGWNNNAYDDPRILAQMPIHGDRLDGMQMWHVLHSDLPKGLGVVTPYYVPTTGMWKHLGNAQPAFYNAKDSDMALRNFIGIRNDLNTSGLWPVYERHVVQVHRVFNYMSGQGVLLDKVLRNETERTLQITLDDIERKMEQAVPQQVLGAKPKNGYVKQPKSTSGMVEREFQVPVLRCVRCGVVGVTKSHTKPTKKGNQCESAETLTETQTVTRWCTPVPFKISKVGMTKYQQILKHQAVVNRREKKTTFDEKAMLQLMKKYPKDPLYPLILNHRGTQKLLSVYVGVTQPDGKVKGGMPTGKDGRIHAVFTSNPSTLRSACQNPNMQNVPRPKGAGDAATAIRSMIVPAAGSTLLARDFSGIEAKLVGYSAEAPQYMRLCSIDVHSYYTAYALNALDGRVTTAELPQLSWSDEKLKESLADIKTRFKSDRNNLYKHLVHAINFWQGEHGAHDKILLETGKSYPVSTIKRVMDVYKELFPEIPRWQKKLLYQVEETGYLQNPFGYRHYFSRPFEYERVGGVWQKTPGPDKSKIAAFLPQSTAAGIIKEAMLRLFFNRFDEAGQYLRLLIHDELFVECPTTLLDVVDEVLREEMERPIIQLSLPDSYNQGQYLVIGTEAKKGATWALML